MDTTTNGAAEVVATLRGRFPLLTWTADAAGAISVSYDGWSDAEMDAIAEARRLCAAAGLRLAEQNVRTATALLPPAARAAAHRAEFRAVGARWRGRRRFG